MATTITTIVLENIAQNALADALTTLFDAATGNAEFVPQLGATVLARIPLNAVSFNAAAAGVITLNLTPVPGDPTADATGIPDNWELFDENGGNLICSGAISSSDTINAGQPVNFASWTITMPAS